MTRYKKKWQTAEMGVGESEREGEALSADGGDTVDGIDDTDWEAGTPNVLENLGRVSHTLNLKSWNASHI